jgi:hypothetical protein
MHIHPDQLREVIAARQQDMLAEAARSRIVQSVPVRVRIARYLRCTAARLEAKAASDPGRVRKPIPDCG